ncbi:MAG TPA: glutaredoxin domain-containing protein [Candidatus Acidoferrales bacterium]|nr:glutaredoxin domain-containing protein [Candidatus Acidoferrales bacterium]
MLELYGTKTCPHTAELRARLVWDGCDFVEHDVEADAPARRRLRELLDGPVTVPVLVEDGRVSEVGWQGRTCYVGSE